MGQPSYELKIIYWSLVIVENTRASHESKV